ncbi:MAG TPA: Nif3-like dinuclear metal center hexameric protein [Tenuifilum sp.]|uniref:Nif3-like dinuclear metal center hexameric protein n=1 Tax=Tenuifilum sp. TaxID=2760880 RepID=UPI002CD37DE5|nr:Nif3-like dinuclear metal center hexameric protein [Tenuifilum sp.]HRS44007.1 Nif3-like dinuclear metal center hexameric protein [Tenuifilum sp.]HRU86114.1 Nif3-like dinuclear metal center hexameric protein [Tenuifilum sp.]
MTVREVTSILESFAPLAFQEDYDNSGLIVGDANMEVTGVLLTIDVTPQVVAEAVAGRANLIVAHHPVIFKGLKRITGKSYVEQVVVNAIKNNVAIYAAHTNIDSVQGGVSFKMAEVLGLTSTQVLSPLTGQLVKLVTFVPTEYAEAVRQAMFNAGAGVIGNYDFCSFNIQGQGTFRAGDGTNPFVGEKGKIHFEPEVRVETIVPRHILNAVVKAMVEAHPYEEVAYDVYPLDLPYKKAGLGVVGDLPEPMNTIDFVKHVKQQFGAPCVRYTNPVKDFISRVAICGGSAISLLNDAIAANADVFITADVKYHQFFDAENRIVILDIGHFESEQFTIDIFYDLLSKKISNFAVLKSKVRTNPINYI